MFKTIKNIFWLAIIIFILYIVLIFIKPALADNIAQKLWISDFNEKIRTIKKWIDILWTKVPTKEELQKAYSWAKEKVEKIKSNIDNIRDTAGNLKDKYEKTKEFIDKTWDKINKVKDSLDDLQKVWEDISNVVNKEVIK